MKKVAKKPVKQATKAMKLKTKLKGAISYKQSAKPVKPKSTKKPITTKPISVSKTKKSSVKSKKKETTIKFEAKKETTKLKTTMPISSTNLKKQPSVKRTLSKTSGPVDIKPYHAKLGEEYMNHGQLEHFRNILLKWKEQLLQEAETTKQDIQTTSANFPDPVDRASLEEEFNLELRARDRERKLIKKIEEALQQINENSYGYCDNCGTEIGVRRLEARPTATQCIECKTISELKEKQIGEIGREEE